MDELRARYTQQSKAYDELVNQTIANPQSVSTNVARITELAADMGKTLDDMLTHVVQNNGATQTQRDELVEKLSKIQKDYNGLIQNTDKLETLRRIRAFEDTSWKRTLYMLIVIFCVAVLFIVGIMLLRNKTAATPVSSMAEIRGV